MMDNFNEAKLNGEEKKYDPNSIGEKTLLIRTQMEVTSNSMLLICLHIFGLKTVHLNSDSVMKEMDSLMRLSKKDIQPYDRSNLYSLYKTGENRVLFEGSSRKDFKYLQSF